jgi:class 3 adenylate cyclase
MNAQGGALARHRFAAAAIVLSCILAMPIAAIQGYPKAESGSAMYQAGAGPIFLFGAWESAPGILGDSGMDANRPLEYAQNTLRAALPVTRETMAGSASYRIRVRIEGASPSPAYPRRMALFILGLAGFDSALVDGKVIYDRDIDKVAPTILPFAATSAETSLILRSGAGGRRLEEPTLFPLCILFGDAGEVGRYETLSLGLAMFETGYFVIGGIFMFLLFLFWRKNREFLAFSLFMVAAGIFYISKNGLVLYFPGFTDMRVADLGYVLALDLLYFALTLFFWATYRARLPKALSAVFLAIPPILAVLALALADSYRAVYGGSLAYYSLFGGLLILWLVVLAIRGDRPARWLLPGMLLLGGSIAFKQIEPESLLGAYLLEPVGVLVFSFLGMLMLVKKVGDAFQSEETLTDYVHSVSNTVRSFIPKEFLESLNKADVIDLRLGDHVRKEMTIFFSDIRAFTELSEKLTVEENFAFINSYLSRVVPIIRENGGFVDKYIGDAIMALYPGEHGPDDAIRSAIAMQNKIVEYNGHRAKMGYQPIAMGVGIHTGDLMLGVVGVSDRMENTVISDSVNLASRLQAITKAFNIALAISEQSFKELEDPGSYKYRFIGKVKVKGKAAPISVFEIFDGIAPDLFERKMKANTFFEQGMLSYYQKDFAGAMYYFKRALDIIPEDGASSFYLENCMTKAAI